MATLNLRISDDIKEQLDTLAQATGRSKSFLAVEAIQAYLRQEAWQVTDIRQAIQEADAGHFAEESDVKAVCEKWLDNAG